MADKKKKNKAMKKALSVVRETPNTDNIVSDVIGSYTGVPLNKKEKPVQDADDL